MPISNPRKEVLELSRKNSENHTMCEPCKSLWICSHFEARPRARKGAEWSKEHLAYMQITWPGAGVVFVEGTVSLVFSKNQRDNHFLS